MVENVGVRYARVLAKKDTAQQTVLVLHVSRFNYSFNFLTLCKFADQYLHHVK